MKLLPILALAALTSCTTFYRDGKPFARIASNFAGKIHVDKESLDIDGTLNNSDIVKEWGTSGSKAIGSATALKIAP